MRILRGHALDYFGFDQLPAPLWLKDNGPPEVCCRRAEGRLLELLHASEEASLQSLAFADSATLIWIRADARRHPGRRSALKSRERCRHPLLETDVARD
jgi:hypothetical protein